MDRKPPQSDFIPTPSTLGRLYYVREVAMQGKVSPRACISGLGKVVYLL